MGRVMYESVTHRVPRHVRGELMLAGFCVLWVAAEAVAASVLSRYPGMQVVWLRYASHLLFMLLIFGPRQFVGLAKTDRPALQIGRSFLMIGMPWAFLAAAQQMGVGNTLAIFWVSPILILLLSRIVLRERSSLIQWALLAVMFAAVLVIENPTFQIDVVPGLLAFGMALCFAGYVVMTRVLREERASTNLFYTAAGVFVPVSVAMPFLWQPLDLLAVGTAIVIGVIGYFALLLLDRAISETSVSSLAAFGYVQPLAVLMVQILLFDFHGRRDLVAAAVLCGCLVWFAYASVPSDDEAPTKQVG